METVSTISQSIAVKTQQLNEANTLYAQAMTAITACGNSSSGCVNKTGRHISTWRDQRDANYTLITRYKKELAELIAIQSSLAGTQVQSAAAVKTTADAQEAVIQAETAQTTATTTKWGLYIGLGAGVIALIIGGIFLFKKMKK